MKVLLGGLICLLLTTTQALALSGGPPYPGSLNVAGVFAGVIKTKSPPIDSPPGCSANSLGVFSVGVPTSGLATGTFVMFSQGRVFSGNIQGVADPGKATFKGVLNATFNFTVTFPSPSPSTTANVTATANGNINARIKTVQSQTALGAAATRLKGSATIDISHGELNPDLSPMVDCEMTLTLSGFKQTNTAPAS